MRPSLLITFSLGLVIFTGTVSMTIVTTSGQAQRLPDEQKPDQITVNTGEVQLDVVVRDKSGRLRKDLTPADFEIYEDGARQVIGSFRLTSVATDRNDVSSDKTDDPQTSRGRQNTVASVPEVQKSTTRTDARSNVSAVALVFDRLSPGQ